jgi:hypothetical protein
MKRVITSLSAIGVSALSVGMLFRIQHYPGALACYGLGVLILAITFILILVEIFISKKAALGTKVLWALPFLIFPIFMGASMAKVSKVADYRAMWFLTVGLLIGYFVAGRPKFVKNDIQSRSSEFDSIDVQ